MVFMYAVIFGDFKDEFSVCKADFGFQMGLQRCLLAFECRHSPVRAFDISSDENEIIGIDIRFWGPLQKWSPVF